MARAKAGGKVGNPVGRQSNKTSALSKSLLGVAKAKLKPEVGRVTRRRVVSGLQRKNYAGKSGKEKETKEFGGNELVRLSQMTDLGKPGVDKMRRTLEGKQRKKLGGVVVVRKGSLTRAMKKQVKKEKDGGKLQLVYKKGPKSISGVPGQVDKQQNREDEQRTFPGGTILQLLKSNRLEDVIAIHKQKDREEETAYWQQKHAAKGHLELEPTATSGFISSTEASSTGALCLFQHSEDMQRSSDSNQNGDGNTQNRLSKLFPKSSGISDTSVQETALANQDDWLKNIAMSLPDCEVSYVEDDKDYHNLV